MSRGWWYVLSGGLLEVFWVLFLKLSHNLTVPKYAILTIISVIISFYIFAKGMELLPTGTAYTVYTGIGAVGTILFGAIFLHEQLSCGQIFWFLVLLIGIIGLKRNTKE